MKKSKLLIPSIIIVVLVIAFIAYKVVLLKQYNTKEFEEFNNKMIELYDKAGQMNIEELSQEGDKLSFKDITFKNILGEYNIESESDTNIEYTSEEEKVVVNIFNIPVCKMSVYFNDKKINSYGKQCMKDDIDGYDDLFAYVYKNRDKKLNVFSSPSRIKQNYAYKSLVNNFAFNTYNEMIILDGKYEGYVLKATVTEKEFVDIYLALEDEVYHISTTNIDMSNNDIEEFIKSIDFE